MKVYRIYKIETQSEWDYYNDDFRDIDVDVTIKYVSSKELADTFIKEHDDYNDSCQKCEHCPLSSMSKRRYSYHKDKVDAYCDNQNLKFVGNKVSCLNMKIPDWSEYYYEEIEVEEYV